MKAIVHPIYGPPELLEFREVGDPTPNDDQVLVRVHAASVGAWDSHAMRPDPHFMRLGYGLRTPKRAIVGQDMAGRVETVGRNVRRFEPGDPVYGEASGTYAEYTIASPDHIAPKPRNLSFEEAAAVPIAGATALIGLRDHGKVAAGDNVLIIGAGGGVGTFAVQIAKAMGAVVTAVCGRRGIETVESLGADHVVDYTTDDITSTGGRYDVIFQAAGTQTWRQLRPLLTTRGRLVLSSGEGGPWLGPIGRIASALIVSPFVSQSFGSFVASPGYDDLVALTEMIEDGQVEPVIDRVFPLSAAAEALSRFEQGHGPGKIVLTV